MQGPRESRRRQVPAFAEQRGYGGQTGATRTVARGTRAGKMPALRKNKQQVPRRQRNKLARDDSKGAVT
jgi:hypothetical protein